MNMIDYLAWRGDLTFAQSEFNEVDNLLLCYLAYVNLDQVAPGMGEKPMTVKTLADCFFGRYSRDELENDKSFIRMAPAVLFEMAKTKRFQNLLVQNYVNKVDMEKMLQFAAMEILLGDGTSYVAYRGTDDTIVGWKEDFYLSRGKVPAEEEALIYLNQVCGGKKKSLVHKILPKSLGKKEKKIRIGGHSKGGHLAIYAAAACEPEIQERILQVYCNDGPGFLQDFTETEGMLAIRDRIHRIVPESSVIGMLLNHMVDPIVIKSSQSTIMQHDGFSWEVEGPKFVRCKERSTFSKVLDEAIQTWLAQIPEEKREPVIRDLFSVLEATGAETLTELQDGGMKNLRILMKQIDGMDSESKGVLQDLLREIVQRVPQMLGIADRPGGKLKKNR